MWYNIICIIVRNGGEVMDITVGDILVMKKQHPGCGSDRMKVIRAGEELKLSCEGCGRIFVTPRAKFEKKIKSVLGMAEGKEN